MIKIISMLIALSAMTIYNPSAQAQHGGGHGGGGGGHTGGGGGGGGHTGGGSTGGHTGGGSTGGHTGGGSTGGGSTGGSTGGSHGGGSTGGSTVHRSTDPSTARGNPTVNHDHVTATSVQGRRGAETVTYNNNHSGRTVLREEYSRGRDTLSRTYYRRDGSFGHAYNYNRWGYRGVYFYMYQPFFVWGWYDPFFSWHHYRNYWNYSWYWLNDPWYRYYGHYYRPYPRYIYPSEWLVDYYWSSLLADDYATQEENGTLVAQDNTPNTTSEAQQAENDAIKAQIKTQIDQELTARKENQPITIDTKILDKSRVYAVASDLTEVTADAAAITCKLSAGDIIGLAPEGISADGLTATMMVRSAKSGSCVAGTKVLVAVEQLAEFENEFTRRLDEGTEKMKSDPTASAVLVSGAAAQDPTDQPDTATTSSDDDSDSK